MTERQLTVCAIALFADGFDKAQIARCAFYLFIRAHRT